MATKKTETDNLCARILDSGSLTTFQTDRAALAADVRAALDAKDAEIARLQFEQSGLLDILDAARVKVPMGTHVYGQIIGALAALRSAT